MRGASRRWDREEDATHLDIVSLYNPMSRSQRTSVYQRLCPENIFPFQERRLAIP